MQKGTRRTTEQENEIIRMAKQRFEYEVHTDAYKTVHADADHLESLLTMMEIREGKTYLDVGTGNGYIAFELSSRFHHISVKGVDITDSVMMTNTKIAEEKNLDNLHFEHYSGITFPFQDASFAGIISRYALHHFPQIETSIAEMYRIAESHGYVLIADPVTYDDDTVGFVDHFQALKRDGHVCFYTTAEFTTLFEQAGFTKEHHMFTQVTYPRTLNAEYTMLLDRTPPDILQRYHITIKDEQVLITVSVFNGLFRKTG